MVKIISSINFASLFRSSYLLATLKLYYSATLQPCNYSTLLRRDKSRFGIYLKKNQNNKTDIVKKLKII